MPRRCALDESLPRLLDAQHHVLSRDQALAAGLSARAIAYRLAEGAWQLLLPDVYLTHAGTATMQQRRLAALLFAGPKAAIDGVDACAWRGMRTTVPHPSKVRVVVPWGEPARSRGFVVVRRSGHPLRLADADPPLRVLSTDAAVIAAAREMRTERQVLAVLSEAVQRGFTDYRALSRAHRQGTPRGSRLTRACLEQIGAGVRSAPEGMFRMRAEASPVLPRLIYNGLLQLPNGRLISPDALDLEAGVVHETNGRSAHAREDLFEDMQERHDVMTAAGLIVLHNSPRRIAADGATVIREFEQCHLRYAGRGLPDGVVLRRATAV